LPDYRATAASWEGLDMYEDILATLGWFDKPKAPLIIPGFEVPT
jgi:hypothetical protein